MAIRDWPRPIRRLIGYSIVALTLGLTFGPLAFVLLSEDFWQGLNAPGRALLTYSAATAGVTTAIASIFACWRMPSDLKYRWGAYALAGCLIGLLVGLAMIPLTVGFSLAISPACGVLTALLVFFVRISSSRT